MIGVEKEILVLMSQVRCATEQQFSKFFSKRKRVVRSPYKKTLRRMCKEFTLKKYPCNIAYGEFKDSSGIYYLNGGSIYKGKELLKVVLGSEIALRMEYSGYEIKRLYRDITIDKDKFDIYIEYLDKNNNLRQKLIDINLGDYYKLSKYNNMDKKVINATIPFFEVPTVLVVTQGQPIDISRIESMNLDVAIIDTNLKNLIKYL